MILFPAFGCEMAKLVMEVYEMQINLRALFTGPPSSEKELFRNIKRCISIFEPERLQGLQPAPEEDIQALEQLIMGRYGCCIPASYKRYLREMGQEDGGILSKRMDFQSADIARDAKDCLAWDGLWRYFEKKFPGHPPFWMFYYGPLAEMGYGLLLDEASSDELVQIDGGCFGYCHDTFSKMLFYFAYSELIAWVLKHGKPLKYKAGTFSSGLSCIHAMAFLAYCPPEWTVTGHAPLAEFLQKLEADHGAEPCWFSGDKEFCLFDMNDQPLDIGHFFARYAAFHVSSGLTFYIRYHAGYRPLIRVVLLSEDLPLTKQITDAILRCAQLEENSLVFTRLDWELVPNWLSFGSW